MLKLSPSLLLLLSLTAGAAESPETSVKIPEEESQQQYDNGSVSNQAEEVQRSLGRDTELFFRQCYINVPPQVKDPNPLPIEQQPINIEAVKLYGSPNQLTYEEDVNLTQGDKNLSADKLTYYIEQEKVVAQGNVNFHNGQVTLYADSIERQLKTNETSLYQTEYQFHGRSGRGDADRVYDNGQNLYQLKRASYSACPPEDNTWSIASTTLYIDNE
ncbi:MAG TPA: LptA/OstA family protein, partial [Psychromonas sp.]